MTTSVLEHPSSRRRPLTPAISRAGSLVLVGLGAAALVLRTRLAVLPSTDRVVALAAIFGAILVASLLAPVAPGRRRLHPGIVLIAGLAAVGGAALAAGRPVPIPFGAWALPLSLLAAVAEEALFRRAAYGALEPAGPVVAIGLTALLFALIHIPLYGVAAFPVDLGAAPAVRMAALGLRNLDRVRGDPCRGQPSGGDRSMKRWLGVALATALVASACSLTHSSKAPLVVGAVYPLAGSQGPGGIDEHRGVLLAADLVNQDGGVNGQPIQVRSVDAEGSDAAPGAVSTPGERRREDRAGQLRQHDLGAGLHRGRETRHALLGDGRGGHAPAHLGPGRPHVPRPPHRRGAGARGHPVHRGPGRAAPAP